MRTIFLLMATLAMARAQLPTITNQPVSRALWSGGNVTFMAGVYGAGPFTYQWQFNSTNLPNGIITTVAGNGITQQNGEGTFSGDGGPAISAGLSLPNGITVDAFGNLFIADQGNNRIRKISSNGIITTVAGNGFHANFPVANGVSATNTAVGATTVVLDHAGNLLIADNENSVIREVTSNGIITTVAGKGLAGASGDGGAATNAFLYYPQGVISYAGDLFIADNGNNRIRKVDASSIITTVAGNWIDGYSGDGGLATNASLSNPTSVAMDGNGNLFITDSGTNRIRKVDASGIITTVAGNGIYGYTGDGSSATNTALANPYAVTVDGIGNLFFSDSDTNRVRKIGTNGIITTVAGNGQPGYSGDGGVATNASLKNPACLVFDAAGNLFIADWGNNRIRKVANTLGPALALNNVTAANAGSYQLVVTGPGGSVTSSVVTLTVTTTPYICQATTTPEGSMALTFLSQPNSMNDVLCATDLAPPIVWQSVSTNFAGPDGNWEFTDTNAARYQVRFYRSVTQ